MRRKEEPVPLGIRLGLKPRTDLVRALWMVDEEFSGFLEFIVLDVELMVDVGGLLYVENGLETDKISLAPANIL